MTYVTLARHHLNGGMKTTSTFSDFAANRGQRCFDWVNLKPSLDNRGNNFRWVSHPALTAELIHSVCKLWRKPQKWWHNAFSSIVINDEVFRDDVYMTFQNYGSADTDSNCKSYRTIKIVFTTPLWRCRRRPKSVGPDSDFTLLLRRHGIIFCLWYA